MLPLSSNEGKEEKKKRHMAFKYLPLILASRWNIYSLTFMLYKDDVLAHNGFTKKKKKSFAATSAANAHTLAHKHMLSIRGD